MSNQRFVLSKNEVLKQYDKKLSFQAKKAIAMMEEESMYGDGDVGRLMQIQQFKGGDFFEAGRSTDWSHFQTWIRHYKEVGEPFLVVRVPGSGRRSWVIIYKRRYFIEYLEKKKYYQTHPEVKERQKLKNRKVAELKKARKRRRDSIKKTE